VHFIKAPDPPKSVSSLAAGVKISATAKPHEETPMLKTWQLPGLGVYVVNILTFFALHMKLKSLMTLWHDL